MAPSISVLLPAYDAELYIDACLGSLCASDYPDLEICVVDDGSADGTAERLDRWAASEPRIRLRRQDNRGVAAARNALIEMAEGELLVLQDADDVGHSARIGWIAESYSARGWDLFHSRCFVVNCAGEIRGASHVVPPSAWLLRRGRNPVIHGSVAIRRAALDRVGRYRQTAAEDLELWQRFLAEGMAFHYEPHPIYARRIHAGSVSARSGRALRAPFGDPSDIERYWQLKVELANRQRTLGEIARSHPLWAMRLGLVECAGRLLARRHRQFADGFPGLSWAA